MATHDHVDSRRSPPPVRRRWRRPSRPAKLASAEQALRPRPDRACCSTRAASSRTASWPTRWRATCPPTAWSPAAGWSTVGPRCRRQRPDRQGRVVGRPDRREDRPDPPRSPCATSCRCSGRSTPPAPGSPTRSSCSPAGAAPAGSSTTRCAVGQGAADLLPVRPVAAGGAYIPAFCDVVIMVEGNASMYLGSPRMAEMVVGEKVTLEEMGGARMHCQRLRAAVTTCSRDDAEAIELAKQYFSYLPGSWRPAAAAVRRRAADPRVHRDLVPSASPGSTSTT